MSSHRHFSYLLNRLTVLHWRSVTLIILIAFTSGCGLINPQVIIVTATPSASAHRTATAVPSPTLAISLTIAPTRTPTVAPTLTVGPTATPSPSLTPLPTPTTPPQSTLDQANTALRNGDDQTASVLFGSIASQTDPPLPANVKAAAEFGQGVANLRANDNADAITALSRFLADYPTDQRAAFAYFLRGDAETASTQWVPAIADYQTFMQLHPGLLDSYAWERIGDADVQLGNTTDALTAYQRASQNNSRSIGPLTQIREKTAAAYLNAKDITDAVAVYDSIVQIAQIPTYRATTAYTAAQILLNNGDKSAYPRLQAIAAQYPDTPEAYNAVQALIAAGQTVDPYLHGQISYSAGDYGDAAQALTAYLNQTATPNANAYLLLGEADSESGNLDGAQTALQTIFTQYPNSPLFGQAWLAEGRALLLAGRPADAIAKYQALADQHPNDPSADEALWRVGYLYSTSGDSTRAHAAFESLVQRYPQSNLAQDALFRDAMAAYNAGNQPEAQRLFSLLSNSGTGNLRAAGALWLGRLYQIQGNDKLARQSYAQAAAADAGDSEGYYSLRAADLLAGHGPFVPPKQIDWTFNDSAHLTEADRWLRATFPTITQPGALWPLSNGLANDPQMQRGDALWAIADYEEADAEYAGLRDLHASDPLALYQLAGYFYRIGLYREAIATAQILIDLSKQPISAIPRYVGALCYPIAYYDLILPTAQSDKVDPLLVFSVIRQESLFQPSATSYAAAQGLMQIIPDTGTYIANELNWPNYQNSDLYRPYVNVTFGISYLKEQLDSFDGNPYAALAAYNAGPANSHDWLKISNGDPDLFLQAIDIDQTQTYVRRIYLQYNAYATIYAAK